MGIEEFVFALGYFCVREIFDVYLRLPLFKARCIYMFMQQRSPIVTYPPIAEEMENAPPGYIPPSFLFKGRLGTEQYSKGMETHFHGIKSSKLVKSMHSIARLN